MLWVLRIAAFVLGVGAGFGVEIGIVWGAEEIFSRRLVPRGLAWLVIPLLLGIAFAAYVPRDPRPAAQAFAARFRRLPQFARQAVFWSAAWALVVVAVVFLFTPEFYDGRVQFLSHIPSPFYAWERGYWVAVLKIILFPPLVAVAVAWLYGKLVR